jgi:TRAP-type C4-dicarboxylate transport system permease small subunit
MVRIPLWLPQGAMTLGLAIFALALLDELVSALSGRTPAFVAAEGAKSIDDGGH